MTTRPEAKHELHVVFGVGQVGRALVSRLATSGRAVRAASLTQPELLPAGVALAGKRADFVGDPDLAHTYSYVPDIAEGLATLGTDERAIGQVWHLPGPETVTTRAVLQLVAEQVGHPVGIRTLPKLLLRALGLVSPMMRGLAEMSYEFDEPFLLDTTKFRTTFGSVGTPLETAVADTVTWYRTRASIPR